ncbi:hypothetical protein ACEN33_00115 [Ruoffia sp. FAM 24228]|uniref:hypothetical protein n=1 Tax=Ruoffia sp. FAM 24228 TaxID=3259517 RepID=UPI003887E328
MKTTLKTLTLITAGLVVGVVVGRVGKKELAHKSGFLLIDIDNSTITDVINEYLRVKNKN